MTVLAPAPGAQHAPGEPAPTDDSWREDPYTEGDERFFAALGYVGMGPMTWADGHDTVRIERDLGNVRIRWIETAHFKIGSELEAIPVPREREHREPLRVELRELAKKLPRLEARSVRDLDPWLRAHLYAQRLENLYDRVLDLVGLEDGDFPDGEGPQWPSDMPAGERWMGRGPYLGMRNKFLVLLCQKQSTCSRYLATYPRCDATSPFRWYFQGTDCFFFGTAVEFHDDVYAPEHKLHAHVVFNVANNLISSLRGYSYEGPKWWSEGLAHVLRREVTEDFNDFTGFDGDRMRAYTVFEWPLKVRQRLSYDLVRPLREIMQVQDCNEFTLVDHMACWSRMSWMLEELPADRVAELLLALSGIYDAQGLPPKDEDLVRLQTEVFQRVLDATPEEIDARWRRHVERHYPRR